MITRASAWDITAGFVKLFYNKQPSNAVLSSLLKAFCDILELGYNSKMIAKEIRNAFTENRKFSIQKFCNKYTGEDRNLLKQKKLHVMPWLNNILPPSKTIDDIEQGVYRHIYEARRFYAEPIASLEVDDIVQLVYDKLIIDEKEYNPKRLKGIIHHLIGKYDVEIVLFIIYVAMGEQIENRTPITFNKLEDLYSIAKDSYEEALNYRLTEEVFYVVPKERMLFD